MKKWQMKILYISRFDGVNMKYIEAIKNYKGLKMILSENTKFDTLLYRQHCNRLDKDEKDQFNVKI